MNRCPHCGLGHAPGRTICPATGLPVQSPPVQSNAATARNAPTRDRRADRPRPRARQRRAEDLLGQIVAGFRIHRLLGEGGMGSVYEAQGSRGEVVAVKVLKAEQAARKDAVSRFEREGKVLSAMQHRNICQVYSLGRLDDGSPFMVMERLVGETLARRIERDGRVEPRELVQIVFEALGALDAAHRQRIIHRDFKPENIFISAATGPSRPTVKVLDFGISKDTGLDDANAHLTRTGMVMGTPYYMAPEQAMGDRNLDGRVDVWAAGVVLYESLSGRRPFIAKNYNALLVQILTAPPMPIDQLVPNLPRSLSLAVSRAMEKKRDQRLQSVADLAELLAAVEWNPQSRRSGPQAQPLAKGPAAHRFTPVEPTRDDPPQTSRSRRRASAVDLRASIADEEEPTTVLSSRESYAETPLMDDQEMTEVDPPRFFDVESTQAERRRR
jgi:serine/threonine protein kinase